MNTKSKRYLNRSQHAGRIPRHYSHLIEETPAVKIGLCIFGICILFLALVVLSALL